MFPNPWVYKAVWRHQICEFYQNVTGRLVFMIVFGIHCNFFILLPIWLKTYRSNVFLFFTRQNMRARKVGRVWEVLRVRAQSGTQFVQACKERNLKWFNRYFSNRKQLIEFSNENTDLEVIPCEVPQVSIHGRLLFLLFVSDLKNQTNLLDPIMFTDDTASCRTFQKWDFKR